VQTAQPRQRDFFFRFFFAVVSAKRYASPNVAKKPAVR
jgi:hypothetical protein